MAGYRSRKVTQVREARLFSLSPGQLAEAAATIRRAQLLMIDQRHAQNIKTARAGDHASSQSALVLGGLLAALGFEALAESPAEEILGLGRESYRRFAGLDKN